MVATRSKRRIKSKFGAHYPPLWIVAISLLSILAALAFMIIGAFQVGATWDERIHALMTETLFETGWYASPDWLVDGGLDPFTGKWPYFVYAPVASLIAHTFAVIAGSETWSGFSDSSAAYAARHLGTAFIAFLGILAAGAIVRLITRSWKWALLGAAILASTPMWVGHGMFNVKDLPVGAGYTIATVGFVAILRSDYPGRRALRIGAVLAILVGVVLAVGTRPASGLPIALTGLAISGVSLILILLGKAKRFGDARPFIPRFVDPLVGLTAAYAVLVVIYPNGFMNPFRLVKETLLISGRFPVSDPELTNGTWLSQPPPWFYLPTWFGAQLTILTLVGAVVFLAWWLASAYRLIGRRDTEASKSETVFLATPVMAQVIVLPILAIAAQSTMYDAVRQFLFVVPAMAVIAALGVRVLVQHLESFKDSSRRWVSPVLWIVVGVGLVVPVVDQIRLFPYNYVYFNELATVKPINGNWATDYWRASSQELTRIIPEGETSCILIEDGVSARPCDADASFRPFWEQRGQDAVAGALVADEYWLVRENGGDIDVPAGCSLHGEVTRPLKAQTLVISQVLRCTLP